MRSPHLCAELDASRAWAPCLCDRRKAYGLGKGSWNAEQVKFHARLLCARGVTCQTLFPRQPSMFAFLSCQWAAICCSEGWSCGWEKRDGDGLCAQKTHQPAPCLAPAPVSPQDRLGRLSWGFCRLWWGRGSLDC